MYVERSIITGPRFLSDMQTIKRRSLIIFFRQLYWSLVRLEVGFVLLNVVSFSNVEENWHLANSVFSEASGGFHHVGMYREGM